MRLALRRTIEQRRADLMKYSYRWGDYPPARDSSAAWCCKPTIADASGAVDEMSRLASCKNWSLESLCRFATNFVEVPRVQAWPEELVSQTLDRHDTSGVPLIIYDYHKHPSWPQNGLFEQFCEHTSSDTIQARDIYTRQDKTVSALDFYAQSRQAPACAPPREQQRLYGKDLECPPPWAHWLHHDNCIPNRLIDINQHNLLMNDVEALMVYIGRGGTYTPSHKDPCASTGHNLMCHTENNGSSFWFMTESSDAGEVAKYFGKLNKVLDHENYLTTLEELRNAPFKIYIAEQKVGDLVIVPPRSCHQVVNSGGLTVKLSWSRMTLQGLTAAIYHELPLYRRVCRVETYRVKATLHHAIRKWTAILKRCTCSDVTLVRTAEDLAKAIPVFDHVLKEEYPPSNTQLPYLPQSRSPAYLRCDFCGCDIFESFFDCPRCTGSHEPAALGDGCLICPGCFANGRSCLCGDMRSAQCQPFDNLLQDRENAIQALQQYRHANRYPPVHFNTKRSLAENHVGTFRAGCILLRKRQQINGKSRAYAGSKEQVLPDALVYCRMCHRSKPFLEHLQSSKLHLVSILLDQAHDKSHSTHHKRHGAGKEMYDSRLEAYRESEKRGTEADVEVQMVALAETFNKCRPLNSSLVKAGWYDDILASDHSELNELDTRDLSQQSSTSSRTWLSPDLSDRTVVSESAKSSSPVSSVKNGKKRKVFDCVLICPTRLQEQQSKPQSLVSALNSLAASTEIPRTRGARKDLGKTARFASSSDIQSPTPLSPVSDGGGRPRKKSRLDVSSSTKKRMGRSTSSSSYFTTSLAQAINVSSGVSSLSSAVQTQSSSFPTSPAVQPSNLMEMEKRLEERYLRLKDTDRRIAEAEAQRKKEMEKRVLETGRRLVAEMEQRVTQTERRLVAEMEQRVTQTERRLVAETEQRMKIEVHRQLFMMQNEVHARQQGDRTSMKEKRSKQKGPRPNRAEGFRQHSGPQNKRINRGYNGPAYQSHDHNPVRRSFQQLASPTSRDSSSRGPGYYLSRPYSSIPTARQDAGSLVARLSSTAEVQRHSITRDYIRTEAPDDRQAVQERRLSVEATDTEFEFWEDGYEQEEV